MTQANQQQPGERIPEIHFREWAKRIAVGSLPFSPSTNHEIPAPVTQFVERELREFAGVVCNCLAAQSTDQKALIAELVKALEASLKEVPCPKWCDVCLNSKTVLARAKESL